MLTQCTNSANVVKVVVRHVQEWAKKRVRSRSLTDWGKRIYTRRKETVERSFADAKQLHGHRYARMRRLRKVVEQCLLAAAAQNVKKIALLLAKKAKAGPSGPNGRRRRIMQRVPVRPSHFNTLPLARDASRPCLKSKNPTLRKTWG